MQRKILSAIVAVLISSDALAQTNCENLDWKSDADTAFQCIGDYQRRLADLEDAIKQLIDLETRTPLVRADHSHDPGQQATPHNHDTVGIPEGAVLMFAFSGAVDPTEPCPQGWSLLQEATGRMPIGAGQPSLKLDADFVREFGKYEIQDPVSGELTKVNLRPHVRINDEWQYYRVLEVGGAELVTLTRSQMPTHSHNFSGAISGTSLPWWESQQSHPMPTTEGGPRVDWKSGESSPHNNMPPYIALYFCKLAQ